MLRLSTIEDAAQIHQFWQALQDNNLALVRTLIQRKPIALHIIDEHGQSPLTYCLWKQQYEMTFLLLAFGFRLNVHLPPFNIVRTFRNIAQEVSGTCLTLVTVFQSSQALLRYSPLSDIERQLLLAVVLNDSHATQAALAAGASSNISFLQDPLFHLAVRCAAYDTAALIEESKPDLSCVDQHGKHGYSYSAILHLARTAPASPTMRRAGILVRGLPRFRSDLPSHPFPIRTIAPFNVQSRENAHGNDVLNRTRHDSFFRLNTRYRNRDLAEAIAQFETYTLGFLTADMRYLNPEGKKFFSYKMAHYMEFEDSVLIGDLPEPWLALRCLRYLCGKMTETEDRITAAFPGSYEATLKTCVGLTLCGLFDRTVCGCDECQLQGGIRTPTVCTYPPLTDADIFQRAREFIHLLATKETESFFCGELSDLSEEATGTSEAELAEDGCLRVCNVGLQNALITALAQQHPDVHILVSLQQSATTTAQHLVLTAYAAYAGNRTQLYQELTAEDPLAGRLSRVFLQKMETQVRARLTAPNSPQLQPHELEAICAAIIYIEYPQPTLDTPSHASSLRPK